MFNVINSFIPASGCVGMGHSALLFLRAYNAVKTALPAIAILSSQTALTG
jgi:hypothetical protein